MQYQRTIKYFAIAGISWAILGTLLGLLNQVQLFLHVPDANTYLSYGIVRPIYTTVLLFGAGLSIVLAAGYYVVQKAEGVELKYELLGLVAFATLQIGVLAAVLTILGGTNSGREYGEMPLLSVKLIILPLILFLVSICIALAGTKKVSSRAVAGIIFGIAGGCVVFLLGNFALPYSLLGSAPLHSGFQDAAVQEYYRFALLGFFILIPAFALSYYFVPALNGTVLKSGKTANLQILGTAAAASLAGGAGLLHSAAPQGLQTLGMTASLLLGASVLAGTSNLRATMKVANEGKTTDGNETRKPAAAFFQWGLALLFLWSILRALIGTRFAQSFFGYTWLNILDISLDMQTYALFIFMGALYAMAEAFGSRKPSLACARVHLYIAVVGIIIIFATNILHGLMEGFAISSLSESGKLLIPDWLSVKFVGALVSPSTGKAFTDPAMRYILSLRGLALVGYTALGIGTLIGGGTLLRSFLTMSTTSAVPSTSGANES